ncbi:hypothetical protein F5144DRAFT_603776 [Chaetomium tenue]|uniref:Uncharacterized protein n=1 Tax=Chaetomium tenue TaxID=1854479 RepID=A0ACB7P0Z9_9PEZI|nr:hypothetical protein F5144DRAFT_603776 [Chaetomium globosum]
MGNDPRIEATVKSSWTRRLTFQRQPRPNSNLDDNERQFLDRSSDRHLVKISSEESKAYLLHLRTLADGRWLDEWDNLFDAEFKLCDTPYEKTIQLCNEMAGALREHGAISINRFVQKLQQRQTIRADLDLSYCSAAHTMVFSILGWLSLLYVPATQDQSDELRINLQATHVAIRDTVSTEMVGRPLDELLRSFGELLPFRNIGRTESGPQVESQSPRAMLEVSHLNVSTLKDMANMQIIWVDSLSEHLAFDPITPSVSIFKCPSFCQLQKHSDRSTLAIMLRDFYEDDEKPSDDYTPAKLLREVMLSYTLLFKADRRSRRIYQRSERARASLGNGDQPFIDPCLDELCGYSISTSATTPVRESYDANIEFPVFKARLERIQQYIRDIQPNRLMSLWRDRRDLRLWYTIWAVIVLTVIGLIIAAISVVLAGIQVNYARLAYDLQLKEGHTAG